MRIAIIAIVLVLSACSSKKEPSKAEVCRAASKNQLEVYREDRARHFIKNYDRILKADPFTAKQGRDQIWSVSVDEYGLPSDPSSRWDRFQTNCEGDKWTKEQLDCVLNAKTYDALRACEAFELVRGG